VIVLGLSLTTLLLKRYASAPLKLPFVRGGPPMKAMKSSLEFITDTEVGFPNHTHFARSFKKREGVTPTAWRRSQ
jgi:hypothetical protein